MIYDYSNLNYYNFYSLLAETEKSPISRDYILISTEETYPVSIEQVVEHMKLDTDNLQSDTYYNQLILTASMLAEFMMRREIIEKQFRCYFPYFYEGMQIRKAPLLSVDSVEYLTGQNEWETLDTEGYYVTDTSSYSALFSSFNYQWPSVYSHQQPVKVTFTCGMDADAIPINLQHAILNHVAVLHEQRGDWGSADLNLSTLINAVPMVSKLVYNSMRITNR